MCLLQELGGGEKIVYRYCGKGRDRCESRGCDASKASVGRHFIKEPQMWTGWIEAWEAEICGGLLEGRWEGC